MGLSRNILLSMAIHCMCVAAVAAVVGRGAGVRVPSPAIPVTLMSEATAEQPKPEVPPAPVRPAAPPKVVRKTVAAPHSAGTAPPPAFAGPSIAPTENPQPVEQTSAPSGQNKGISIIPGAAGGASSATPTGTRDGIRETARISAESSGGEGARRADAINLIRTAIERARAYPAAARRRGMEGTASVEFNISGSGRPANIRIVKSSGSQILDAAALETITKAGPFPVVSGMIEVPIVYRLEK